MPLSRRELLRSLALGTAGFATAGFAPARTTASPDDAVTPLPPDVDPRIEQIISPLAHAPSLLTTDRELIVEIDPERLTGAELAAVTAGLSRSFGTVAHDVELGAPTSVSSDVDSSLWVGRNVHRLSFELPDSTPADLYDLTITWGDPTLGLGSDLQRRAVSVLAAPLNNPRIVVLADPSAGDPRPVQDGQDALLAGDPFPAAEKFVALMGNPAEGEERWAPLIRAIDEINLVRPDIVLMAGDLTFALHARVMPYEYEDAYRILDRLEVPSFANPGNHDLYSFDPDEIQMPDGVPRAPAVATISNGVDAWESYFGPLYYSVDLGPDLHLTSINTFDYDDNFVFPPDDEFNTLAGGRISPEQLEWLTEDLTSWRAEHPAGEIVTLAHHDPSWLGNRHAWFGEGRMQMRELFAAVGVGVHLAGHTHEDRVARYHDGNIVQTNGRSHRNHPFQQLSYIVNDGYDVATQPTQGFLGRVLHDPSNGPLYVTTTTAGSGLRGDDWGNGGYWGYRVADLVPVDGGGYDPVTFGYQATRSFLDATAERPERWTPEHNEFGVFSYPSYFLDAAQSGPTATVTSGLEVAVPVAVRLVLDGYLGGPLTVDNGVIVSTWRDGARVELLVRVAVPPHGSASVTAQES